MRSLTHTDIKKLVPANNPLGTTLGTSMIKRPWFQYTASNARKYMRLREQAKMLCCDICGYRPKIRKGMDIFIWFHTHPDRRLIVDHCHTTEIIRGLLCNKCNPAIGLLRDMPSRLTKAAKYCQDFRTWHKAKYQIRKIWGLDYPYPEDE